MNSVIAESLSVGFEMNKIDVGPYLIWQEEDGCTIREIKKYEDLHPDFSLDGFMPASETLPYRYQNNCLIVTSWMELLGWSIARPIRGEGGCWGNEQ